MARRRAWRPVRKRIFFGTEGESEAAFGSFLQKLCNSNNLHLHLDICKGRGGSPMDVLMSSVNGRKRGRRHGEYAASICIMDCDRLDVDPRRQEIRDLANKERLDLVLQNPDFEGLLVRLHPGQETRQIPVGRSQVELRRHWQDYAKPPIAKSLADRFDLADLGRAAAYDEDLRRLLRTLGLRG